MAAKYYTTALAKVAGSSTQFTADIYLAGADNVGSYGAELAISGNPANVTYAYTAATLTGFTSLASGGISGFSSSTTAGGTFPATGTLIGSITVSFAAAPTADFKLAVVSANLDNLGGVAMPVNWDTFALYGVAGGGTPDTTPPAVTAFSPADEATGVGLSSNIVLTFSESIQRGSGSIVLKKADGTTVATYAQSSTEVTVSGSTLTINPAADLSYATGYKVEFAAGSVNDSAGNSYAGTTSYNFTTAAAPVTVAKTFNDPLFSAQWYLVNTGQRGGDSRLDINILSAWEKYTGKDIVVAVNDDGMDLSHPSLVSNLLINLAYDGVRGTTGEGFVGAKNSHGTVVGSIVGMAGNDGVGGVGVAYEAKIVPGLAIASGVNSANLFLANLAAGAAVSVNSWGQDPAFAENFGVSGSSEDQAWGVALLRAATEARSGLGMVIEVSGGNERGNNADTALSNFTGNKLVIAVGAITETGAPTNYSTKGASLLLTAPGGVGAGEPSLNSGFGIASADVQGIAGYNTTAGADGDYTYQNEGTSYSGPMVGGAAALMLQANPTLGFRDVSTILALTARKVDPSNPSWVQNSTTDWNLGGMHFSRDFGYGLLDVSAAVRLAESWALPSATVANWRKAEGTSLTASSEIPDDSASGFTAVVNLADKDNLRIERMEFDLNLAAASTSQLSAVITSPGGTQVTLFDQPLTRSLVEGAPTGVESGWPDTFTIGSTAFLGENSAGKWSLRLVDKVTGITATYNSLTVRAWGSVLTTDSQYVLTNEFVAANPTINDASGSDTLNAAAVDSAVRLDLRPGSKSSLAKGEFTISDSSVIENAIGGLGADTLTGNASNNLLRGNAGNDTLDGGAGTDKAQFLGNWENYTLSRIADYYQVTDKLGTDGTDRLLNIEQLVFANKTVELDTTAQVDTTAPTISTFSPADEATGVGLSSNIVLTFSESVVARSGGTIELMTDYGSGHKSVEVFPVSDTTRVTISGNVVTIDPTSALLPSTGYHLGFNSALADTAGNAFSYTHGQYNFTTAAANTAGKTADITAYSWKAHTLLSGVSLTAANTNLASDSNGTASFTAVTDTTLALTASRAIPSPEAKATSAAVNLQDAIAILKMIVGLEVNGTGKALSPYQALAADYDGNGLVQLTDAIGVLKHVVGLTAPQPAWGFVNELDATVPGKANLSPGVAQTSITASLSASSPVKVGLVGYLTGDVDGSYAGAAGALDLDITQASYFTALVTANSGLSLTQFGVY